MSLKSQIEADIKTAMLAKDKESLTALRSIKSLILLAETEKGAAQELAQDAELKLLTKAAKQRRGISGNIWCSKPCRSSGKRIS